MKIARLRGPLGAVVIGAALATGSSALADDGGRSYRAAPHHPIADADKGPYRPAPHHPYPGEATIPHVLATDQLPVDSSGGGIDWNDAVIGGAALAVLVATAGGLARRRTSPRMANREEALEAVGLPD